MMKRHFVRSGFAPRGPIPAVLSFALAGLVAMALSLAPAKGFAKPALVEAMSATFRITDGATSGVAFTVEYADDKLALVTCAHAMNGFRGEKCTVIFRTVDDEGRFHRSETLIPIRQGKRTLWKQHASLDIAVLPIEVPADIAIRVIKFGELADARFFEAGQISVGDDVFIPGFPVQLEGNAAGWPVVRKGAIATHPLTPVNETPNIFIDAKTFGGDSGSPVVQLHPVAGESRFTIVGMVWGMRRQTDRTKTPFEERVAHTPLGLAEAVTAPQIRATIELLK